MPIPPPPPPMAFAAVAAAAKVAVKEYLPALSSASLAAWSLRWMWRRVPSWIRDDVVWRRNATGRRRRGGEEEELDDREEESLSSLWERHCALLAVAESLLSSPVPYLPASILAYLQVTSSSRQRQRPDCVRRRNDVYRRAGELHDHHDDDDDGELRRALDWAVWAYDVDDTSSTELLTRRLSRRRRTEPMTLIRRVRADRPGSVGYYVALSDDVLVIAVKGTSSLEDILTDTCGRAVPYRDHAVASDADVPIEVRGRVEDRIDVTITAPTPPRMMTDIDREHDDDGTCHGSSIEIISGHERVLFPGGDTTNVLHNHLDDDDRNRQMRCHEGILLSALAVTREVQGLVQKHLKPSEDGRRRRRRLRLVGHSLGAGVACCVGMILRSRFPWLADDDDNNHDNDKHDGGVGDRLLHVYAFAPPPVLDHDSALSCTSYVTTVVNNADIVPRSSLVNVALWLEVLRGVSSRLEAADLVPATTAPRLARFVRHVYGSGGGGGNDGPRALELLTVEQIWTTIRAAREYFPLRHPDHLYIPGRVLLFYQDWDTTTADDGDTATPRADVPYQCRVTDDTAWALQSFEVDGFRWLGDHTTASYYRCLDEVTMRSSS